MRTPLHFLDAGSGRPVLLLHAFPMNHTMWNDQVRRLQRKYRIIVPNTYGFGQTPLPLEPWSFQQLALALLELADSLRLGTFTVVGLSMGGYTAFEMLREAPERIQALALANTRARADTEDERDARLALAREVETSGVGVLAERVLPRLLKADPASGYVEIVRSAIQHTTPAAISRALAALAGRNDSTELLRFIKQTTLVIGAAEDAITGAEETREWAGKIQHSQYVEIPAAGHLSNVENPDAFNGALEKFLQETT